MERHHKLKHDYNITSNFVAEVSWLARSSEKVVLVDPILYYEKYCKNWSGDGNDRRVKIYDPGQQNILNVALCEVK